jgi:UDP-N-acetylmuramate--alanine ligase
MDADYRPTNIQYDEQGSASFDVEYQKKKLIRITLHIPGEHTVLNALGASIVALSLGENEESIAKGLEKYRLTNRRFEKYGERAGVMIYHDYAHHPSEIRAVLSAAKRVPHNKLICVFQCNSYTRAKTLFTKNVTCFEMADLVLVPDIYPGREQDDGSVHARDMVNAINLQQPDKAVYLPTFEMIAGYLSASTEAGDLVLTLGSGDVYKQTNKLL